MKNLLVSLLWMLLGSPALQADNPLILPPLIGHWEGSARIIVDWCSQQQMQVSIDVHPDSTVTGKVGDATLVNGRLTNNRGWLGRKLNLATDYIVRGDLTGSLIPAEGITRTAISIPFSFDAAAGSLIGGLHTDGSPFGGKRAGMLSAASLTLIRKG